MPAQRKALAYIASATSRNFEFEGQGATETEALAALDRAFFLHGEQYKLEAGWATSETVGEITTRPIYAASSWRDREEMEGGTWGR
jgi:hypothetical protein